MCIKGCRATAKDWARLQNPSLRPLLLSLSNPQVLSEEELCYPISHTGNTNPSHRDNYCFTTPLAGAGALHGSFCPLCTKTSHLCELPHRKSPSFVLPRPQPRAVLPHAYFSKAISAWFAWHREIGNLSTASFFPAKSKHRGNYPCKTPFASLTHHPGNLFNLCWLVTPCWISLLLLEGVASLTQLMCLNWQNPLKCKQSIQAFRDPFLDNWLP